MSGTLGRYVLSDVLASGGMSSVHLGRMRGPAGFGRTVAVKKLHPQFAGDPEFVSMMLDEARLVSRIVHPNVVATLDVVHTDSDLFLILEYVPGETIAGLQRIVSARGQRFPLPIVRAIASNVLLGLDAAHQAADEHGRPLGIVHRDVSPQNVIVGTDGVARLLDFGVAKAIGSSHQSEAGEVKGKIAYMAPEQLQGGIIGRASDVYGASVVLWEMLTGRRLFDNAEKSQIPFLVLSGAVRPARSVAEDVPEDLDDIVMKGLELEASQRFSTAREMAEAIEASGRVATTREVAEWIADVARAPLAERSARVARIEKDTSDSGNVRELASHIAAGRAAGETGDDESRVVASPKALKSRRVMVSLLGAVTGGAAVFGVASMWAGGEKARPEPAPVDISMAQAAPPAASSPQNAASEPAAAPVAPATSSPPAGNVGRPKPSPHVARPRAREKPASSAKSPPTDGLFDRN